MKSSIEYRKRTKKAKRDQAFKSDNRSNPHLTPETIAKQLKFENGYMRIKKMSLHQRINFRGNMWAEAQGIPAE